MEAISHLNPDQATADLNAAADYARKLLSSNASSSLPDSAGGGAQSFRFATNRGDLSAALSSMARRRIKTR